MFLEEKQEDNKKELIYIFKAVSLFSNAGIGDIGVKQAGIDIVYANELLKKRCETYKLNHPGTYIECKDINMITEKDYEIIKDKYIKEALFLLIATPPCQGVSKAGKMDKNDIRNQLIKPTIKAIKQLLPEWVWIENVSEYAKVQIPDTEEIVTDNENYLRINLIDYIKEKLNPLGYTLKWQILDTKDYGVPQSRKRLIIVMNRVGKKITFPQKTNGEGLLPYKTVRDAIGQLEPLESGEKSKTDKYHYAKKHNEQHIKWIAATPEGHTALENENSEDRPSVIDKKTGELRVIKAYHTTYKRMWWDRPAPTVTMCSGGISSQNNCHPRDNRAMTVREAMLLQTIPMDFKFPEGATDKQMRDMIGEAIPTLLSEVVTRNIIKLNEEKVI